MRVMRRKQLEQKVIPWEYGCSTHYLHSLSSEIGPLEPFKSIVKDDLYVSKTVKYTGMVRKLYEQICEEKFAKMFTMVFFSLTRWKTYNIMIQQLLRSRPALTLMSHALQNERKQRQIDPTFNLPSRLDDILKLPSF